MRTAELLACALAGASGWLAAGPPPGPRRLASILPVSGRGRSGPSGAVRALVRRLRGGGVRERSRTTAAIELCDGLAAELRAGRNPPEALRRSIEVLGPAHVDELAPVLAATYGGADVPAALARSGVRPGAAGLRRLAVCFRIGVDAGGAFAPAVERLGVALRDEEAARQEVSAQLAGARATGRLLAALPLLGVALSFGIGINPFAFWFAGPVGLGCLVLGILLDVVGLLWIRRLARRAEGAG